MRRVVIGAFVGLSVAVATAQLPPNPRLAIALGSHKVLPGGVTVENEDVALCALSATGAGTTACTWSVLLDGSAVTLDSAVKALDILPNGSLVLAVGGDGSIADLSAAHDVSPLLQGEAGRAEVVPRARRVGERPLPAAGALPDEARRGLPAVAPLVAAAGLTTRAIDRRSDDAYDQGTTRAPR
jgi:hypothetical protein